jgi:hypothetical protein
LSWLAACGQGVPGEGPDLAFHVVTDATVVAPGEPFRLTVVRRWPRSLEPEPLDPRAWAPLVLQPMSAERREGHGQIEETRHFAAQALALDDVRLPAVTMRARAPDGSGERLARSDALIVRVHNRLDPRAPGAPEAPPGALAEDGGRPLLVPGALLALVLLLLGGRWLRRRRVRPTAGVAPDAAAVVPAPPTASALLADIEAQEAGDGRARAAQVAAAADLVRMALGRRWGRDVRPWLDARLVQVARDQGLAPTAAGALEALLQVAERVKFGGLEPARAVHRDALVAARTVIGCLEAPAVVAGGPA